MFLLINRIKQHTKTALINLKRKKKLCIFNEKAKRKKFLYIGF